MESRLKERLTGAAILVALIVLVVPEVFHGRHAEVAAPASSGEGPPMRSYTIDLSNNPSGGVPLQPATPVRPAAPPAAASAVTTQAVPAASALPHPSPVPATSAAEASPPPAAAIPPARPARAPAAAAAETPPVRPTAHAAHGEWGVQLGLFAQHENAERLMHAAQAKGFDASISSRDARGRYRVMIEHLSDRSAAVALEGRLRERGFAGAVVPPH